MAEQYTVYVVEDDTHIRELLLYNLQAAGYRVQGFASGEDVLPVTFQHAPDVMLLDLMLPGLDGMEICRRIRAQESCKSVRIIMVTARGEEVDRVLGLELGADDYIVKPFSVREVLARVKAVLRRYSYETDPSATHLLSTPEFSIDAEKRVVMRGSEVLHLPLKEFDLLYYLMSRPDRVLTREQLLDQVWGYDFVGETRTVDVHIRHLRMKLEKDPDHPIYIQTVRGVGYRFVQGV